MSVFFENLLESHSFIDIPSAKVHPTWRNNRTGEASLARRLDRFLTKEDLVNRGACIRQWVSSGGLSDHRPIYLELQDGADKPKALLKFNSTWLRDMEYIKLVTDFWKANPPGSSGNLSQDFTHNMKELKVLSKAWAMKKKEVENLILRSAEEEILSFEEATRGIAIT